MKPRKGCETFDNQKKIKLSNILMILISIVITTIVVVICLQTSLGSYWYTLQAMYSDENGIQFAQSMIYNYQQELWENNWSEVADSENPHEIQEPLTSIRGYVEGLLDGIASTPEKQEKYLRAIQVRTGNMVDMVNSLSEYNRLNSREFRYHMEQGNLRQFVEQYLDIYMLEARQKQVDIEFYAAEEE